MGLSQIMTFEDLPADAFCFGEDELSQCEKRICKTHAKKLGQCPTKKKPENCVKYWNGWI
jgi:hypothetical protein